MLLLAENVIFYVKPFIIQERAKNSRNVLCIIQNENYL